MPKQPAFPGLRDAMKKKQTRRELFLAEMDAPMLRSIRAPTMSRRFASGRKN